MDRAALMGIRFIATWLVLWSCVSEGAGFGDLSLQVADGITASAGIGTFAELVTRDVGGGVANKGVFDGVVNSKAVQWWGYRTTSKAAVQQWAVWAAKKAGWAGVAVAVWDLYWNAVNDPADEQYPGYWQKNGSSGSAYATGVWANGYTTFGSPYYSGEAAIAGALAKVQSSFPSIPLASAVVTVNSMTSILYKIYRVDNGSALVTTNATATFSCAVGQTYNPATQACSWPPRTTATDTDISNAFDGPLNDPPTAKAQAEKNKQQGHDPLDDAGPVTQTTGPATAPSTTTKKTNPDGSTVTTTSTPGMTYSNTSNVVNISNTTTVTTCTVQGSCTTETTKDEGDKPVDETDFCTRHPESAACLKRWCDEHPNASGCVDLGEVTDVQLETVDLGTGITSERSAVGSCPADIEVEYMGQSLSWSWAYVCGFAEGIRPIVLILAWLSAAWFFYEVASRR